jgi:hypothetical protein
MRIRARQEWPAKSCKINRESANSRVQEGDVGEERSIYAGARQSRWNCALGGGAEPEHGLCSGLPDLGALPVRSALNLRDILLPFRH